MLPGRIERCRLCVGAVLVLALGTSPTNSSSCERKGWYSERIERADIGLWLLPEGPERENL